MAIRLDDLLASFRRHLRAAAKAPRTIELYGQSVRHFSRWLSDRGREPVLDELTRHAVAAGLAELAEICEPSTSPTRSPPTGERCWIMHHSPTPLVAVDLSAAWAEGRSTRVDRWRDRHVECSGSRCGAVPAATRAAVAGRGRTVPRQTDAPRSTAERLWGHSALRRPRMRLRDRGWP
jgi:Phage integrase, N-terminal SAM-like domain